MCIRYADVNRAIQQAKFETDYVRPRRLESLEPEMPTISQSAEMSLKVTHILAKK